MPNNFRWCTPATYQNFFNIETARPEPTNHSVLPSLVEFKFSAVPYFHKNNGSDTNGTISLAMHPTVSLWNPYNVPIRLDEIFIEIPLNVNMRVYNPKEWSLLYEWYKYWSTDEEVTSSFNQVPFHVTSSNSAIPSANFDLNGNGKRDPGEPRLSPQQTCSSN